MNPQDISNLAQAIQILQATIESTQAQINDLRNENNQLLAEVKASSMRNEQKDAEIMSAVEAVRTQVELTKAEASSAKRAVDGAQSHIDAKISDVKSDLHSILRTVR